MHAAARGSVVDDAGKNEQQRQAGKDNFNDALKITRREMVPGLVAIPSVTAFYFGYDRLKGDPVRAALLGAGGQGRSHIDSLNPDYIRLVAFSDIRPSNQKKARVNLEAKLGTRAREVELVEDYHKLLDRKDIEMVIVSLPLHLRGWPRKQIEDRARELLEVSVRNVDRLTRLVGDLLDLSRIQAGRMELHPEPVALEQAVEFGVDTVRAFAAEPLVVGGGPYGPLKPFDANGIALPEGFSSREIAREPLNRYLKSLVDAASDWTTGVSSKDYPGYDKIIAGIAKENFETQTAKGAAWVGSPDQIRKQISDFVELNGDFEIASVQVNFNNIPYEDALRSMTLFSKEVMPHFASLKKAAE